MLGRDFSVELVMLFPRIEFTDLPTTFMIVDDSAPLERSPLFLSDGALSAPPLGGGVHADCNHKLIVYFLFRMNAVRTNLLLSGWKACGRRHGSWKNTASPIG